MATATQTQTTKETKEVRAARKMLDRCVTNLIIHAGKAVELHRDWCEANARLHALTSAAGGNGDNGGG